jgi:hypothetical protein
MSDSPKYRGTETERFSMAAPNLSAPPRSRSDLNFMFFTCCADPLDLEECARRFNVTNKESK